MKVLQINCVYNSGSTGKIVYDIHTSLLAKGYGSVVCYGRGKKTSEPNIYKTCSELYSKCNNAFSRISGLMYGGCKLSTRKLISIIKQENPDVVHLHCINGYFCNIYDLLNYLNSSPYKVVLTLHAEFMYTGNCGHALECENWKTGCGQCPRLRKETRSLFFDRTHTSWQKMKYAFDGFGDNLVVASVSSWLMERAKQSPMLKNKRHCVILNGIDTERFFHITPNKLREQLQLEDKKVVLHVTASYSNPIKGGKYVTELARKMPETAFVIIGNNDQRLSLPSNIIDIGRIEDKKELAAYYSMADVLLLTSERETFCMPVAESLCCGTPVVGFKAGAPEQISLSAYSTFIERGDFNALEKKVREWISMEINAHDIEYAAKQKYSKENMVKNYCDIYFSQNERTTL